MKRTVHFLLSVFLLLLSLDALAHESQEKSSSFVTAASAGYVFKNDCTFKDVYGHGMVDVLTVDGCYYPWEMWGFGAKVSYWRAHGKTTFLKECTLLQEVPVTVYARIMKEFNSGLQLYASLGGGFTWIKEKSYFGNVHIYKGIGEIETGIYYPVWRCVNITGAFRYLFPPQNQQGHTIDVGGCDLRVGIGFSF